MIQKIDQKEIAQDWKSRGFSCDLWTDPPGTEWEDYSHEVDELLMVLSGEVELEMKRKKWKPAIGEEVFIPAKTIHSVRNKGLTTSRWLYGYKHKGEIS